MKTNKLIIGCVRVSIGLVFNLFYAIPASAQGVFSIAITQSSTDCGKITYSGWTLVMQASKANSLSTSSWNTTAAVGTFSNDYSTTFKLSDSAINSAAVNQQFMVVFWVNGTCYSRYYSSCTYSHTSKNSSCRTSYSDLNGSNAKVSSNDWPYGGLWDGDSSWEGNVATNGGGQYGHTWCIEKGNSGRPGYCWDDTTDYSTATVTEAKFQMWAK